MFRSIFQQVPRLPVLILALVFSLSSWAQEEAVDATVGGDAIEAKIRALAPNAELIAISETPIAGLLQVQINSEIYYASADAKYLITGRVIDLDTRVDITDQAKSGIRKTFIEDLDPSEQIVFSPVKPQHEVLVFTDIDCGYCRKLHDQMDGYLEQGIAIHYLAFPRAGVGSHSFDKYVSVWCADDPQAALTDAKAGAEPEPKQCENPIEDQYKLGRDVGVTGTPALLTSDGLLIPGYMPPEQLKMRLDAITAQAAASP
jgi:thiol:disulfide interchange protein DsbC